MLLLVEHLLLLGVELADRRKKLHVPVFEESVFPKEPVDEGHVALHRAQHDPDDGSRLLRRALPRLRVGEVLLAQNLPVGARTALSRRGSLSQVLGRWKRLEEEEADLLKRSRPTKK